MGIGLYSRLLAVLAAAAVMTFVGRASHAIDLCQGEYNRILRARFAAIRSAEPGRSLSISETQQYLATPEVRKFIADHRAFNAITAEDNKAFIALVKKMDGNPRDDLGFFQFENVIGKEMNDRIFFDLRATDSVVNSFKKILLANLNADPVLASRLAGYSDYKLVRLAFKNVDAALVAKMDAVYKKSALEFETLIRKSPLWHLVNGRRGIAGRPSSWFMAGVGRTADYAEFAARAARSRFQSAGAVTGMQDFDRLQNHFWRKFKIIEALRQKAEDSFGRFRGFLVEVEGASGRRVLPAGAFEIISRVRAESFAGYVSAMRKAFRTEFGISLNRDDVLLLRDLHANINAVMPGNYIAESMTLPLWRAREGIIAVDFRGQNAANLFEVMKGLARDRSRNVPDIVRSVRKAYDRASADMALKKEQFTGVVMASFGKKSGKNIHFSGDDGIFIPQRALGRTERMVLLQKLAGSGNPSGFRVSFVEKSWVEGGSIGEEAYVQLKGHAELIEKNLRFSLRGVVPPAEAKKVVFGIHLVPSKNGRGIINIYVSGNVDRKTADAVKKAAGGIQETGYRTGEVILRLPDVPRVHIFIPHEAVPRFAFTYS